jgi:hypothetical protein
LKGETTMKTFVTTIAGVTPFMMHRFSDSSTEELKAQTRKINIMKVDPREAAEQCAYRTEEGYLYFPGEMPARMLREAGAAHKQRGSRRSLKYIISAVIFVGERQIILRTADGVPISEFEIDSRPVVIPSTKGRILRHRPLINDWYAEFSLEIDDSEIAPSTVFELLQEGGKKHGLGDYRPNSGGPFGKFQVHSWAELGEKIPVTKRPHAIAAE